MGHAGEHVVGRQTQAPFLYSWPGGHVQTLDELLHVDGELQRHWELPAADVDPPPQAEQGVSPLGP